eukprot:43228-Eustigmatos_ZCMA.PRE.1
MLDAAEDTHREHVGSYISAQRHEPLWESNEELKWFISGEAAAAHSAAVGDRSDGDAPFSALASC